MPDAQAICVTAAPASATPLQWDIFCRVIDNFGDLGVCWRLCRDLAARGQRVHLWVDDASALGWMAPERETLAESSITVLDWEQSKNPVFLRTLPSSDVWIEAFGCDIAPEFIASSQDAALTSGIKCLQNPAWINLEYLSAEGYVARCHGLASPVSSGPARGSVKHFFYPGFNAATGGLLREPGLAERQRAFDTAAKAQWLQRLGVQWQGERLISLFCYEPAPLAHWLAQLAQRDKGEPVQLLVCPGRPQAAVLATLAAHQASLPLNESGTTLPSTLWGALRITFLPTLSQDAFDALLWCCDLNCVRGEDSLVRAIWAGKALLWHIYPQEDGAQHPKLHAFLQTMGATPTQQQLHQVWNGTQTTATLPGIEWDAWGDAVQQFRARLLLQNDLCTNLLGFIQKKY